MATEMKSEDSLEDIMEFKSEEKKEEQIVLITIISTELIFESVKIKLVGSN